MISHYFCVNLLIGWKLRDQCLTNNIADSSAQWQLNYLIWHTRFIYIFNLFLRFSFFLSLAIFVIGDKLLDSAHSSPSCLNLADGLSCCINSKMLSRKKSFQNLLMTHLCHTAKDLWWQSIQFIFHNKLTYTINMDLL